MSETPERMVRHAPLSSVQVLARFASIGAVLLAVVAAFAYTAGWLSSSRVTQTRLMAAFAAVNGDHPGFRRNHAKGLCVTGWFESNGAAIPWSRAAVFAIGRVPLEGRFALAGGMPYQTDTQAAVRSMALRLLPPGAQEWRTGMNNTPVFAVNSAQGFYDQLLAAKPDPASGKPDPAAMREFFARHPEAARAAAVIQARSVSSGFADTTFNSLNAFRLVNAAGLATAVRWATEPLQEVAAERAGADPNYLFDELIAGIHRQPLRWRLVFAVARPGDPTNDATLPWPADRARIDAGTVSIDRVFSETGGACDDINFDPLVLPDGIEPSDDPLLSARSSAYARSFTLRIGEKPQKLAPALSNP
jgi:catalase